METHGRLNSPVGIKPADGRAHRKESFRSAAKNVSCFAMSNGRGLQLGASPFRRNTHFHTFTRYKPHAPKPRFVCHRTTRWREKHRSKWSRRFMCFHHLKKQKPDKYFKDLGLIELSKNLTDEIISKHFVYIFWNERSAQTLKTHLFQRRRSVLAPNWRPPTRKFTCFFEIASWQRSFFVWNWSSIRSPERGSTAAAPGVSGPAHRAPQYNYRAPECPSGTSDVPVAIGCTSASPCLFFQIKPFSAFQLTDLKSAKPIFGPLNLMQKPAYQFWKCVVLTIRNGVEGAYPSLRSVSHSVKRTCGE